MKNDDNDVIEAIGAIDEGTEGQVDADWAVISKFEVMVNQRSKINARVYANANQQVPVQVVIEARDNDGVVVSLSPKQLRSIKLIDYHNSEVVEVSHDQDTRFIYHWEPTRDDDADEAAADSPHVDAPGDTGALAQSITLYVTKTVVSTQKVAAEITSPSGGVFRTNTPNPPTGKFDSWINVQGVQQLHYQHTDLIMERVDDVTNDRWDVDLYYVRFCTAEFQIVDSVHIDVDADKPHLHQPYGPYRRFHIAFKAGARRTISYSSWGIPTMSFEVNKRPGQATAARITVHALYFYPDSRREACVHYYNQYGNVAKCAFHNTYTNDYNVLTLGPNWHG